MKILQRLVVFSALALFTGACVPCIFAQPALAQSSVSAYQDSGLAPSTWTFDAAGRVIGVPGCIEATRDETGQLVKLVQHTPVQGGTRTTTYTWLPNYKPGQNAIERHYVQDGAYPGDKTHVIEDVRSFDVVPYFIQLQPDGSKVEVSTNTGLTADKSGILAGVRIKAAGEESVPYFVGSTYRRNIHF